ncbi:MAG: thermonuclease family protein [Pseudomonadota bacterium]
MSIAASFALRSLRRAVSLALLPAAIAQSAHAQPNCGLYDYRAEIVRVIDGDTVVADIDLGFNTWRKDEHLRLRGIDAPEIRGEERPEGLIAAEALRERLAGRDLVICTIKDRTGSFGRFLVDIYDGDILINDWMIEQGYAVRRD